MKRAFAMVLLCWGNLLTPLSAVQAQDSTVTLPGHVLKQIQSAVKLDQVSPNETIPLILAVKIDQKLLDRTLQQIYDPHSPNYKHFLTSSEFAERFGMADKRQKLKDFAEANGLTVDPAQDNPQSLMV